MSLVEVITFATTIALGILSIGLAVFAIWLSYTFDKNATATLGELKALIAELRILTSVGLKQQENYTHKMLDNLLMRDKAINLEDNKAQVISEVVTDHFKDLSGIIVKDVEKSLESFIGKKSINRDEFNTTMDEIRSSINATTGTTISTVSSKFILPEKLKHVLSLYKNTPKLFNYITMIINENVSSQADIGNLQRQYGITEPWKPELEILLRDGIIDGTPDKFNLNPEYATYLRTWVEFNRTILFDIISTYLGLIGFLGGSEEAHRIILVSTLTF